MTQFDNFVRRCKRFFNATLNLLCAGDIPEDIILKYGGKLVKVGEPYSVFALESQPSTFLIIFRSEETLVCKSLKFLDMTTFQCFEEVGKPYNIQQAYSHVMCIDYRFAMADELATTCGARHFEENEFAALYYANLEHGTTQSEASGASAICSSNILMFIVIAVTLVLLIFRWRM